MLSDAGRSSLGLATAAGVLWWQSCSQRMIFSKPGVLKVKAAEEMGCFCMSIAFSELKTSVSSSVNVSVKNRAVCCAPDTVQTHGDVQV